MHMRSFVFTLLASTALTSVAMAQTPPSAPAAPVVDPNAKPAAPAAAAAPAAPAPAATAAPVSAPTSAPAPVTAPKPAAAAPAPVTVPAAPAPKPAAAAPQAAPAPAAQAPTPKPATAAAAPVDFGTVSVKVPDAPKPAPALVQSGMTASPTDYAVATEKKSTPNTSSAAPGAPDGNAAPGATAATGAGAAGPGNTGRPTSLGGVTGQDLGGGYMIKEEAKKSRSTVTRDAIDKQGPTANPYQLINLLPGVVQSSTDNDGLNGGNIKLRGFNSDKIGLTIEGMPVNDSGSYSLFPQEYVDAENIGQISIAQGSPELDSPHIGSTGGVINIYMIDPSKVPGAVVDYSFGSHATQREFVRINSGQVGPVRAFLSYSNYNADHWGGNPGENDRQHMDFKIVGDISPGNTVRFSAIYNTAENAFYPNPTKKQFDQYADYKNLATLPSSFFATPPAADLTKSINGINQSSNNAFNYYKYRVNPFRNLILSAPSNFTITPNLKFDTVPYYWYGFGSGGGTATMNENGMTWGNVLIRGVNYGGSTAPVGSGKGAVNDSILYYNPSITQTFRPGVVNKFTFAAGDHKIVAGHWFEYAYHRQTSPYVPLNPDGTVQDNFAENNQFSLPAGATCNVFTPVGNTAGTTNVSTGTIGASVTCPAGAMQRRDQLTVTTTNAVFLGDSWKATKDLSVDFGVKQLWVNRAVNNYVPGSNPAQNELNDTATLPTAAVSYKLNEDNKVFGSFATTFRTAPNFTLLQSFSNSGGTTTSANPPPAEKGMVYELGHRYQGKLFSTSLTGFYGKFENYQQSTNIVDPSNPTGAPVAATINAGGVVNYGVDAEFGTAPIYNFRPYISGEWLHTELQDNLAADGFQVDSAGKFVLDAKGNKIVVHDFLPTKGKQLAGAPQYSLGFGLDYDDGHFFANANYKFLAGEQASLMNDEQMHAHGRLNAGIGYRFSDIAQLKQPEIKINFYNILNSRQLTGVNSVQQNTLPTTGILGSSIAGSSANYYQGQDFSFLVTLRAGL
jgi:iron complex outermembrane recepter protein